MTEKNEFLTLTQAAKEIGVTRGAIYAAINKKRLVGHQVRGQWLFTKDDLEAYKKVRYTRGHRMHEGRLIHNPSEGRRSVTQAADYLREHLDSSFTTQKVYYQTRSGYIKSHRKGCSWVILDKDLHAFIEKYRSIYPQKEKVV